MNVSVLQLMLHNSQVGKLFKFFNGTADPVIRFVADESFIDKPNAPLLSLSMVADDLEQQRAFWNDVTRQPAFNGVSGRMPVFFQNLLPEGVFRRHLAELRDCNVNDHFELLAACGMDLQGAIKAIPITLTGTDLARLVTQGNDSLEMSVTADPLPMGVSISGMQPKLGLIEEGGRYVTRRRNGVTRIIGKLPQIDRELLPEVELMSMQLAQAAGVKICDLTLEPLTKLNIDHGYTIGGSSNFLAVKRFDRDGATRIHCEDFAQALGVDPDRKYAGASYAAMAAMMMRYPSMGEEAVHQLLRQITVNELMGNYDAHLKNFCVLYQDGSTPTLAPAFDIVAWSVYLDGRGSALALYRDDAAVPGAKHTTLVTPAILREFCSRVGIPEKPASAVIKDTVKLAASKWAKRIDEAPLMDKQKARLHKRLQNHYYLERYKGNRKS
jgi:serine/threonine-protein kinase HipA